MFGINQFLCVCMCEIHMKNTFTYKKKHFTSKYVYVLMGTTSNILTLTVRID
jgi:hypothetical protein